MIPPPTAARMHLLQTIMEADTIPVRFFQVHHISLQTDLATLKMALLWIHNHSFPSGHFRLFVVYTPRIFYPAASGVIDTHPLQS
jgi:hypothetical protein